MIVTHELLFKAPLFPVVAEEVFESVSFTVDELSSVEETGVSLSFVSMADVVVVVTGVVVFCSDFVGSGFTGVSVVSSLLVFEGSDVLPLE